MAEKNSKAAGAYKRRKGILPAGKGYAAVVLLMALVAIAFLVMMAVVDAFPRTIALAAVGLLFALLILTDVLFCRRTRALRVFGLFLAVVFFTVYGLGTYYLGTTYAMFSRISKADSSSETEGVDITEESFNIYITGIDQWNKEKGLDLERSDVNMIVTVCPKTRKILLTSIPRDTYVPLASNGAMDKLTHTGVYGVDETIGTVEGWLGLDMNYYVKMNFSAVRDVIDAMGGIDVYSPVAFESSISNYKYVKGWNHLNGKAALFFARERKAFDGKDSIRVENQQRVVKACIDKMTSSTVLLTKYGDIVGAAGASLETNMSNKEMQSLVKMQLGDLGAWDIQTQKIEGDYDMDYVASLTQESKFLVYKASDESVASCKSNIEAVMNPSEEEIQAFETERKKKSAMEFIRRIFGGGGDKEQDAEAEGQE